MNEGLPGRPGDSATQQFWLSRLQVINWGVFDGYHTIEFSRRGTLITGSSGSGKSSLLDAISLAFLSSNRRNFNASSDTTAAGSSMGKRTVDKYVRGLWGELKNPGERPTQMFLRGKGAAWSAIAVTYSGTDGRVITGLVLKWLAPGSDSDSSSRYYLIDADADIRDLCNSWASKGYSAAVFDGAGWRGHKSERWYLEQLYAAVGIQGSSAAQQLLGKAKSLKSVGGLEQFVREYMLDEPESMAAISEALGQITPLVDARAALAVAQRQRQTLGDIEQIQQTYASDAAQLATVDVVDHHTVRDYVDQQRLALAGPEIDLLDTEITRLGGECDEIQSRQDILTGERDKLLGRIAAADSNLAPLKSELAHARARAEEVSRRRTAYDSALWDLGHDEDVESAEEFEAMRVESLRAVTRINAELEAGHDAYVMAAGALSTARDQLRAASSELKRVEHVGTSVPPDEDRMRGEIAAALGLTAKELPYVCELMDLRPGQERWRRSVEKVLRSTGLCLLVPDQHHRQVLRYVNENPMRGYLQMERVIPSGAPRRAEPGTLADCLRLTNPNHECASAAMNLVAAVGDYVLVDTPDEFSKHRRAVTDQGLRKDGDRRAVKDDRRELRASQYIYQGNAGDKRAALSDDVVEAQQAVGDAEKFIGEMDTKREELRSEVVRWSKLHSQYEYWSQIDTDSAEAAVARLQDQYDAMLEANPDLTGLQQQADSYLDEIKKLSERIGALRRQESEHDSRRTRLLDLLDNLNPREVGGHTRSGIEAYVPQLSSSLDVLEPDTYRLELWRQIEKDQSVLRESVTRSRNELNRILNAYDRDFPDSIPNDSENFDEKIHDYVALCRRIDERDLPAAYEQMLRLITEQAPTAVLRLHQLAEEEAHRITDQIDRVNSGLGSVEFNRGTRLTLRAEPKALEAVGELNERARRISGRAVAVSMGDEKAIHDQYQDILQLRNLLAAETPEARQWTRDALDVRNRFVLYCEERDAATGEAIRTYSNAGANSGGEQEKLMAFCLAGALSFNLANPETGDNRPVFAQLMLDEAFSKSDPQFAQQALSAFRKFGFQLVIVATVQNTTTIQPYIDSVVMVSKPDGPGVRPVASTRTVPIGELGDVRKAVNAR
ncbi:nuclease [Mycobacterium sp. MHSD3]|uniref:ATP-binding protein n=1 Tax=Mycobacteroides TaxID=670516 RepID=UPI000C6E5A9F|nr:ATP-binding protein [Mycobacteroides chelonae]MBF9520692.1 AAA family ATPase [Mycobacteroides chelonae]PKQ59293.1 nuclease [Mycobacterium sp. MHSD3]